VETTYRATAPTYRIVDEPRGSRIEHLATRPYFPLLALVLGGAWVSWPWFAVNAIALGGMTRRREILLAVAGFAGSATIAGAIWALYGASVLGPRGLPYAYLVLTLWKLGVSYWLYELQERAAEIRQHYVGRLAGGAGLVMAALIARGLLAASASSFTGVLFFLYVVVS
jgi:hypothetical protein